MSETNYVCTMCAKEIAVPDSMVRYESCYVTEELDLLISCAKQFLMEQDDGTVIHSFMEVEERLCEYLVRKGKLQQTGRNRFRFT
jgi:hypothetical protein